MQWALLSTMQAVPSRSKVAWPHLPALVDCLGSLTRNSAGSRYTSSLAPPNLLAGLQSCHASLRRSELTHARGLSWAAQLERETFQQTGSQAHLPAPASDAASGKGAEPTPERAGTVAWKPLNGERHLNGAKPLNGAPAERQRGVGADGSYGPPGQLKSDVGERAASSSAARDERRPQQHGKIWWQAPGQDKWSSAQRENGKHASHWQTRVPLRPRQKPSRPVVHPAQLQEGKECPFCHGQPQPSPFVKQRVCPSCGTTGGNAQLACAAAPARPALRRWLQPMRASASPAAAQGISEEQQQQEQAAAEAYSGASPPPAATAADDAAEADGDAASGHVHRWLQGALQQRGGGRTPLAARLYSQGGQDGQRAASQKPQQPPARNWDAFRPPENTYAAVQEERQRREHQMKLAYLQNQELQGDQHGQQQGGMGSGRAKPAQRLKPHEQASAEPEEAQEIVLPDDVTVRDLASLLGCDVQRLEDVLRELGERPSSLEDMVPVDIAELAALELGKLAIRSPDAQDRDSNAEPRPAVVTVMGHVDHGKTSLLDALRKTAVAASEAGGITQHIGAFEVALPGSQVTATFLDTPGHAAFSAMRARGASVTDIVILVVAANDGVMPQTEEALAHARTAGCPIIVALTKCDMPNADPARVKNQLLSRGLLLEEAGGNVLVVKTAAPSGVGLVELEEALLLQAELMDLRAGRSGAAEGAVVEARLDKGQGPVATVIVKRGVLRPGQYVVVGTEWGRVRALRSAGGAALGEALPGQPAEVSGLRGVPQAGDELMALPSDERARRVSAARTERAVEYRRSRMAHAVRMQQQQEEAAAAVAAAALQGGQAGADGDADAAAPPASQINLIVKADVQGSAEAVRDAVQALGSERVGVKVVATGVGPVSERDVEQAQAVGAHVLAFNVRVASGEVDAAAKRLGVDVLQHSVIYRLLEEVGERMAGAAPRVERESVVGQAEVLQVFQLGDGKRAASGGNGDASAVAGCRITEGSIRASVLFRVLRNGEEVHRGLCASLKRHKLGVERVGKGSECGVLLQGFKDVRQGDVLQCIEVEMVQPDKKSVVSAESFAKP